MASAGSIFIDLLLRDSAYRQGLDRSSRSTRNFSNSAARQFSSVIDPVEAVSNAVVRLGALIGGALSVEAIVRYSDEWKRLEGRLSIVTENSEELAQVQERLFKIAQESRTDLSATTTLYQRLQKSVEGLGISQEEVFQFTERFNKALITSGLTAQELRSTILQLTQAFNKGKLDGDEFRSVLENAPPVLEALVKSLKRTDETFAEARARIVDSARKGVLTPGVLVQAINQFDEIESRFERFSETVEQSFTKLNNAFLKFVGESTTVESSVNILVRSINFLSENLDTLANIAVTAAIAFSARTAAGLGAALLGVIIPMVRTIGLTIQLNVALAVAATNSRLGAAGLLAMRGATVALGAALKALIPTAAVLSIFEIVDGNESLIETQEDLKKSIQEVAIELDKVFAKNGRLTDESIQNVQRRIDAYRLEAEALETLISDRLDNASNFEVFARGFLEFFGEAAEGISRFFGGDFTFTSTEEAIRKQEAYNETIRKLNDLLVKNREELSEPISLGLDDKTKKFLARQRELNKELALEAEFIGKTTVEIDKLRAARELDAEARIRAMEMGEGERAIFLRQIEGIKAERLAIIQSNYELARSFEAGFQNFFVKFVEDATNAAKNVQDVLSNAFKGAEDAFIEFTKTGKLNFKELASSIIEDLLRIQFRQAVANIINSGIAAGLGSLFGGSGALGNLFGANVGAASTGAFSNPINSSAPILAFADGGYLPPGQFGIAGEEGAELLYGGKTGVSVFNQDQMSRGNTYIIDAKGADQGALRRIEASLIALAGPGVIERRVLNAQQRGSL